MSSLTGFLIVYLFGGLTFFPLLIVLILLHAYFAFPIRDDTAYREKSDVSIARPEDDVDALKSAQITLGEKLQLRNSHESDVAAGYFTITREFVPGGVNGKPPERSTPLGSTTVSAPSPSVYQSMYRSIFDRKQSNSPLDNKGPGKPQKKGGNVFYVVLRHGHLMLFDDDQQIEVRHVISLAHHDVSIYSGGDETPEGELFIKKNAIKLSRRVGVKEPRVDNLEQPPYYLYSENCSDKEDFYFVLRNQETNPPIPLHYEVKDIITLVQRLHSSEEHLQTRWINALIGRVFLALYKTSEVENFVRAKITKKISRVKTPSFLSKIALRNIDMGEAAPVITNPRLKDLTVDGELVIEADVRYSGSFSLQVAATARIELGTRFKAREVNLLLAVVLKRVEGHVLIRLKQPPSNRIWTCFETMPKIDMTVEPIVSSRQITYTLILRQIENRIKEVIAESLVFPNWDDSPFFSTEGKFWRGGIWANDTTGIPRDAQTAAAQDGDVDEVEQLETENDESIMALPHIEKSASMPVTESSSGTVYPRKSVKSMSNLTNMKASGSSTSIDTKTSISEKPRALRSGSFASASSPVVSTDITNADAFKDPSPPNHSHATSAIAAISALSQTASPELSSPSRPSRSEKSGSQSSVSSTESTEKDIHSDLTPLSSVNVPQLARHSSSSLAYPPSPSSFPSASLGKKSVASSSRPKDPFGQEPRRENSSSSGKSTSETKRLSLAAVTNAAASAKNWGWNALQRRGEHKLDGSFETSETPGQPLVIGRGRPLPPPGTPLPFPDKKSTPIAVPKRKLIPPPPVLPQRPRDSDLNGNLDTHPLPPPPLPRRRRETVESVDDGLLVVSAPSEPTTPKSENTPSYMRPWVDDVDEGEDDGPQLEHDRISKEPPRLPKRRVFPSSSPEEDSHKLPSWLAAQEEEARSRSAFVNEDSGV